MTTKPDNATIALVEIPDAVIYRAAGLDMPATSGESRKGLTDEVGVDGPIKECARCGVDRGGTP